MALADALRKAAKTAVKATGDIPVTVWYYQQTSTTYDVSSGVASTTSPQYEFDAIFMDYVQTERDAQPADLMMLVPQVDVIFKPSVLDRVQRLEHESSVQYEVVDVKEDPAKAIYMFKLQKP